jgi:acyl-CoA synthetase (AMP-forming)/AMP-acid ligase II
LYESFRKFKNNIAVENGNRKINYGQLDRQSHCITNWMIRNEIKEDTIIGILADDRIVVLSAIIAILKAKCVFVPLDTSNPPDRLEKMIDITKLKRIFVDKNSYAKYSRYSFIKESNIELTEVENLLSLTGEKEPGLEISLDFSYSSQDRIYIYFTSGSTGEPKAVIGKNISLLNYCRREVDLIISMKIFEFVNWQRSGLMHF